MKNAILLFVFVLGGCVFSNEKHMEGIVLTQQIFLDTKPNLVHLTSDSIVPGLREGIISEIDAVGLKNSPYSEADVLLKVKTKFRGNVPVSQIDYILHDETSLYDAEGVRHDVEKDWKGRSTKIDKLLEDPSGMIIGFAVGAALPNPIVLAPLGMALGAGANLMMSSALENEMYLTVLEVEIHERSNKPLWYTDKRVHVKDENSIRKYEYSEEIQWKIYKTRVVVYGEFESEEIAKRIASLVI